MPISATAPAILKAVLIVISVIVRDHIGQLCRPHKVWNTCAVLRKRLIPIG